MRALAHDCADPRLREMIDRLAADYDLLANKSKSGTAENVRRPKHDRGSQDPGPDPRCQCEGFASPGPKTG